MSWLAEQRCTVVISLLLVGTSLGFGQAKSEYGHSHLGSAFDSGLRSKPWKFEGLGSAPFPISVKNPEVQEWYDQGNELLHSFWFEEAERTFRWCLKLEPDNAMAYFGLARCGLNWFTSGAGDRPDLTRFRAFLKEAVKRKDTVTLRERMYIEAWDAAWSREGEEAKAEIIGKLQTICTMFPDDIEAKTQLSFFNIGQGSALANEFLIQQVLAVNPMHPGAHHARIHNWDGIDGVQGIASCELYGKAAPGVGHALHMPGHIYSGIGMWHEAAIAMDSATRVELKHMNDRLALPLENWNYPHNRDYLSYIQEQLGRAEASIQGSKDILNSPKDPEVMSSMYPAVIPLIRACIKFERWEQILNDPDLQGGGMGMAEFSSVARILALAGLGRKAEAIDAYKGLAGMRQAGLAAEIAKAPDQEAMIRKSFEENQPIVFRVVEAKILMLEGKRMDAIRVLLNVADTERKSREEGMYSTDPPMEPWPVMRLVGDAYLEGGDLGSAIEAYKIGLEQVANDAWCLAGLAKAHAARGEKELATGFAGRFLAVWSGADPNLSLMKEVLALNLNATPNAETVKPERKYVPSELSHFGPSNWQPFAAPALDCLDTSGKRVQLSDFRGKNVLLVFYLSDQCVHCMEQLGAINAKEQEFSDANTVILAVSSATPAQNKESLLLKPFDVMLLSDKNHENARRFASYDDFEDMELHSTTLIDAQGRVRWKRSGGDPFGDVDFLLNEIKRWRQ
jgi:peroxiredoxin/tetratricopeptide (TPR) repeat protein